MGNVSTTFEQAGEEFGGATGTFEEASTILGTVEESAEGVTSSAKEASKALRNIVPHGIDTSGITSAASDIVKSIGGITSAAIAAANALAFMSRYTTDIPLGGTDNDIGKHAATGLERVPYDGFPAILHKDEMVLDRQDANAYRNGDAPGPSKGGVTVIQNIQSVPQTASELAFQTMNALEMLRFSV